MIGEPAVPLSVRLRFGRAAVQTLADSHAIPLLHLKGEIVDPSLRPDGRTGGDVDVLVHPDHVARVHSQLLARGWSLYSTFEWGSPFGHAQTYLHPMWGFLDLHRFFPGIGLEPGEAFDQLWASRTEMVVAGVACPVPDVDAQAVILLLNAARAGQGASADVERAWLQASDAERERRRRRADLLDARLAFDAAIGELDRHRGERGYALWKAVSRGGGRFEEWWGRVRAAPDAGARIRLTLRAALVNTEHLARRLGHPPSRREIVVEFFARPARGVAELVKGRRA